MLAGASLRFPSIRVTETTPRGIPTKGRGGAKPMGVVPLAIGGIMLSRLKHLVTFGLSSLSIGLAILLATPPSGASSSSSAPYTLAMGFGRPRPWVALASPALPSFEVAIDPGRDFFELAGEPSLQIYVQ